MTPRRFFPLLIIAFILLLHFWNGQHTILFLRPQSVHQWAQCDRASVALNYYQHGMDFFTPRVHNLDNGTGITGMEFPLMNYSVAILYKIFGYHEFLYRLLELLIFSAGLYGVFYIARHYLQHAGMSLAILLIYGSIPLLAFYTANFLPDIISLSFVLIAWSFLIHALKSKEKWYALLSFVFFWLASLIKITALMYLPVFLFTVFSFTGEKLSRHAVWKWLAMAAGLVLLTIPWYMYAAWLSAGTSSEVFLLQFRPISSFHDFMDIYHEVSEVWLERLFLRPLSIFLFFFPLLFAFLPSQNRQLKFTGLLTLGGAIVFIVFMWQQFRHHDYYMILLTPLFLISIIQLTAMAKQIRIHYAILPGLLFIFSAANAVRSAQYLGQAYDKNQWYYGATHFDDYFEFEKHLREMGIPADTPVISVFDHSPDISLYLMNQKGVSVAYRKSETVLEKYIASGAFAYLIYNSRSAIENISFDAAKYPLTLEKEIFGIMIYKVANYDSSRRVPVFKLSPWN